MLQAREKVKRPATEVNKESNDIESKEVYKRMKVKEKEGHSTENYIQEENQSNAIKQNQKPMSIASILKGKQEVNTSYNEKDEMQEKTQDLQSKDAMNRAKAAIKVLQNTDGESIFPLSSKRQVTVRKWKGSCLIDIREFWTDKQGVVKPGNKGLSLSKDQWENLIQLRQTIDNAIVQVEEHSITNSTLQHIKERVAVDSEEGSIAFSLSSKRRLTVRMFSKNVLVDLREYYGKNEGEMKPGKKGISLTKDQWYKLMEQEENITLAIQEL